MGRQSPSACRVIHSARLRFARSFLKSVFSAEWPCQAARECFLSSLPRFIVWTTGSRPLVWCVCCLILLVKQTPQRHESTVTVLEARAKALAGTVAGVFLTHGMAKSRFACSPLFSFAFGSRPCAYCATCFALLHEPWTDQPRGGGVRGGECRAPRSRQLPLWVCALTRVGKSCSSCLFG